MLIRTNIPDIIKNPAVGYLTLVETWMSSSGPSIISFGLFVLNVYVKVEKRSLFGTFFIYIFYII